MPKHDLCGETWLETGSPECNCEDDMSNTDLLQKSESIEDKIDRVFNEVCDGHVPEALEDLAIEIGNALEDLRAALQPPADTRGEVCCCESPDTEPALCSNCCPVHNITPRQCDEAWLCGAAVEMLEQWNAERRKAGLPTATEGSLLDGLSSLLEMLQHDKPARTPADTLELVERLRKNHTLLQGYFSGTTPIEDPEALAIIANLHQAITALEQQAGREWISVEDRLPIHNEDGGNEMVLCYVPGMGILFGHRLPDVLGTIRPQGCFGFDNSVTHWMPIPQPPQQAQEQECSKGRWSR